MAKPKPSADILAETEYRKKIAALVARAPWVLRVTELKDKTGPVLIAKERYTPSEHAPASGTNGSKKRETLRERGLLYGAALRRCIPVIRHIVSGVLRRSGRAVGIATPFQQRKAHVPRHASFEQGSGCEIVADLQAFRAHSGYGPGGIDRLAGRAIQSRRSNVLADPHHAIRRRFPAMGPSGHADHARGTARGQGNPQNAGKVAKIKTGGCMHAGECDSNGSPAD